MRLRTTFLALPAMYLVVAACVGDDPSVGASSSADGGNSEAGGNVDGGGSGDDAASLEDAGPVCGYPGEDCCEAPLRPCREGTTCSGDKKCALTEVVAVGTYLDTSTGVETVSAFYDGSKWALKTKLITGEPLFGSTHHATALAAGGGGGVYYASFFKSSAGKLLEFSSSFLRTCQPGQACAGPSTPQPAFWSVARIAGENWLGASGGIYRCASNPCAKVTAGLESTTVDQGTIAGTSGEDVWYSNQTRAYHFDGAKWTIHNNLKARVLFQVRKDDVWVADQTFQHWDGARWTDELVADGAPTPGIVTSLSGASSKDVWAAGYETTSGANAVFTAHWDGTAWTKKPVPADTAGEPNIYAPSSREAFFACQSGLYHWDGSAWTKMAVPDPDAGAGGIAWDVISGVARGRP